eukprot:114132-Prymnesium_polylepis.3
MHAAEQQPTTHSPRAPHRLAAMLLSRAHTFTSLTPSHTCGVLASAAESLPEASEASASPLCTRHGRVAAAVTDVLKNGHGCLPAPSLSHAPLGGATTGRA